MLRDRSTELCGELAIGRTSDENAARAMIGVTFIVTRQSRITTFNDHRFKGASMSGWISATEQSQGIAVQINLSKIAYVIANSRKGSVIRFDNDFGLEVKEAPEELMKAIQNVGAAK